MKRELYFIVLVIGFFSCSSTKGNKERKINYGKLVYTKYDVITEDAAIKANQGFKESLKLMAKDMDSAKREAFLKDESHNVMKTVARNDSIHFELDIYPDYFIEPLLWKNGKSTGSYKFTNRDSLYQCAKKTQEDFCKRKKKIRYFEESKYIFEYFRNDKKKIFGYECFRINAIKIGDLPHTYEMYVTDKVSLNYNPMINFKTINEKYLILELTLRTKTKGVYTKYKADFLEIN